MYEYHVSNGVRVDIVSGVECWPGGCAVLHRLAAVRRFQVRREAAIRPHERAFHDEVRVVHDAAPTVTDPDQREEKATGKPGS